MGGFPALQIRPPESPIQQIGGALALQNEVQKSQLGEIQLQEARLNQTSQQELMSAFARNNGDLNQTYADAVASGKVTPTMLNQFRQQSVTIQTQAATLAEKELDNHLKILDLGANEFESLRGITDETQFQNALKSSVGRLLTNGGDPKTILPLAQQLAQDHSDAGFTSVETAMKGSRWVLENEKAQREKEQAPTTPEVIAQRHATLAETEAKTLQATAEASLASKRQEELGQVTPEDRFKESQANYRATIQRQATFANELQKNGLNQLDKMFTDPQHGYTQFLAQAAATKNAVMESQNGSQLAASLEPLMTASGVLSFAGIHRINQVDVNQAGPAVGSIYRKVNAILDKVGSGSIPEDTQKEVLALMDGLTDAKHAGLLNGANMVATNAGLDPKRTMIMDRSGVLTTLDKAITEAPKKPTEAGPEAPKAPPAGATHIVPGPDGKNHYTNATGTVDLGVAP